MTRRDATSTEKLDLNQTIQEVLASNQTVLSGRGNNVLYLPLNGAPAPAAGAAAPVSQLPPVRVSPPEVEERPGRGTGREEGR